ncbi:fumarylacetoacetate hydrolase family protein [Snodgrassella sp. CFCC 13594]|uniref:fumarylacetoacetate hydrolase family protein n=1 Tax=Snodgrassella sp. CFCC 13594 TaxID=1775559 RepID=UPI000A722379
MKTIQVNGQTMPLGNIFCIGRNYTEHIKELNNALPTEPVVFMKPTSALAQTGEAIVLPSFSESVHHECELVVYIKADADHVSPEDALRYVGGYAIGLDLTARDVQSVCKEKGLPWTKAKAFAPLPACHILLRQMWLATFKSNNLACSSMEKFANKAIVWT